MSPVVAWIFCDKAFLLVSTHTFSTDEGLLTHKNARDDYQPPLVPVYVECAL